MRVQKCRYQSNTKIQCGPGSLRRSGRQAPLSPRLGGRGRSPPSSPFGRGAPTQPARSPPPIALFECARCKFSQKSAARERVRASGRNGERLPPCLLAARLGLEPVVWTCAVICVIRHYVDCMHLAAPLSQPACSVVWGRWPCRLLVALPCRFSVFSATLCSLCRTTCSSPMTHSMLMGARMIHHICEVHVSSQCMMGRRHGELGGVGVGVASDCQVSTHCPPTSHTPLAWYIFDSYLA